MPDIIQAKLYAYQLPFKEPLNFKGQRLNTRSGLILQLQDQQGHYSFGEIAPLPGFSSETLAQATKQIILHLNAGMAKLDKLQNGYPSVQFALDNALMKTPISTTISHYDTIPLLQGSAQQVSKQYSDLNKPNLIKLKVARHSVAQEARLFNTLTSLNPNLKIRCDANQAWTFSQATDFFEQINTEKVDYIEEPTACHQDNLTLANCYEFSLALDESLQNKAFIYQQQACIKALILKPMLIGSLRRIDHFMDIAKANNLQVSISSSFESILGLNQLTHLAQRYQGVDISLGLDTLKYFPAAQLTDSENILADIQKLECLWTSH